MSETINRPIQRKEQQPDNQAKQNGSGTPPASPDKAVGSLDSEISSQMEQSIQTNDGVDVEKLQKENESLRKQNGELRGIIIDNRIKVGEEKGKLFDEIGELEEKIKEQEKKISILSAEVRRNSNIKNGRKDGKDFQGAIENVLEDNRNLRQQIQVQKESIANYDKNLAKANQLINELKIQLEQKGKEIQTGNINQGSLYDEGMQLQYEVGSLQQELTLKDGIIKNQRDEIAGLEANKQQLQKENINLKKQLKETIASLEQETQENEKIKEQISNLLKQVKVLDTQFKTQLEALQNENKRLKEANATQAQKLEVEQKRRAQAEVDKQQLQTQFQEVQQQNQLLIDENNKLKVTLQQTQGQAEEDKQQLQTQFQEVQQQNQLLIDENNKLKVTLQQTQGQFLETQQENGELKKQSVKFENKLEKVQNEKNQVQELYSNKNTADVGLRKENGYLKNQVREQSKSLELLNVVVARKNELEENQTQLTQQLQNKETEVQKAKSELAMANGKVVALTQQLQQQNEDIARIQGEDKKLRNQVKELQGRINNLETETIKQKTDIASANATIVQLENSHRILQKQNDDNLRRANGIQKTNEQLKAENLSQKGQITELTKQNSQIERKIEELQQRIRNQEKDLEESQQKNKELENASKADKAMMDAVVKFLNENKGQTQLTAKSVTELKNAVSENIDNCSFDTLTTCLNGLKGVEDTKAQLTKVFMEISNEKKRTNDSKIRVIKDFIQTKKKQEQERIIAQQDAEQKLKNANDKIKEAVDQYCVNINQNQQQGNLEAEEQLIGSIQGHINNCGINGLGKALKQLEGISGLRPDQYDKLIEGFSGISNNIKEINSEEKSIVVQKKGIIQEVVSSLERTKQNEQLQQKQNESEALRKTVEEQNQTINAQSNQLQQQQKQAEVDKQRLQEQIEEQKKTYEQRLAGKQEEINSRDTRITELNQQHEQEKQQLQNKFVEQVFINKIQSEQFKQDLGRTVEQLQRERDANTTAKNQLQDQLEAQQRLAAEKATALTEAEQKHQEEIGEKDAEIARQKTTIDDRDAEIVRLKQQNQQQAEQVEQLRRERDENKAAMVAAQQRATDAISNAQDENTKLRKQTVELEDKNEQYQQDKQQLQEQIEELKEEEQYKLMQAGASAIIEQGKREQVAMSQALKLVRVKQELMNKHEYEFSMKNRQILNLEQQLAKQNAQNGKLKEEIKKYQDQDKKRQDQEIEGFFANVNKIQEQTEKTVKTIELKVGEDKFPVELSDIKLDGEELNGEDLVKSFKGVFGDKPVEVADIFKQANEYVEKDNKDGLKALYGILNGLSGNNDGLKKAIGSNDNALNELKSLSENLFKKDKNLYGDFSKVVLEKFSEVGKIRDIIIDGFNIGISKTTQVETEVQVVENGVQTETMQNEAGIQTIENVQTEADAQTENEVEIPIQYAKRVVKKDIENEITPQVLADASDEIEISEPQVQIITMQQGNKMVEKGSKSAETQTEQQTQPEQPIQPNNKVVLNTRADKIVDAKENNKQQDSTTQGLNPQEQSTQVLNKATQTTSRNNTVKKGETFVYYKCIQKKEGKEEDIGLKTELVKGDFESVTFPIELKIEGEKATLGEVVAYAKSVLDSIGEKMSPENVMKMLDLQGRGIGEDQLEKAKESIAKEIENFAGKKENGLTEELLKKEAIGNPGYSQVAERITKKTKQLAEMKKKKLTSRIANRVREKNKESEGRAR